MTQQIDRHFPTCSASITISECQLLRNKPNQLEETVCTRPHAMSGYCDDVIRQVKELYQLKSSETRIRATGMLVITNHVNGSPLIEQTFGEPSPTTSHSFFSSMTSFLPKEVQDKLQSKTTLENFIDYLHCARYVPTERGLTQCATRSNIVNPQTYKI